MVTIDLSIDGQWRIAIDWWASGDTSHVLQLLQDREPIPTFAREWLCDALIGKVKRRAGLQKTPIRGWQMLVLIGLFEDTPLGKAILRTRKGYAEAGRILGLSAAQVEAHLPKTRGNTKGHKPYAWQRAK